MVTISGILSSLVLHTPKTLPLPLKQEPFLLSCFHTHIPALSLLTEKGKEKALDYCQTRQKMRGVFLSWERPGIFQLAQICSIEYPSYS